MFCACSAVYLCSIRYSVAVVYCTAGTAPLVGVGVGVCMCVASDLYVHVYDAPVFHPHGGLLAALPGQ